MLKRGDRPYSFELVVSVVDSTNFVNESKPFRLDAALSFTRAHKHDTSESFFYWTESNVDPSVVWEFVVSRDTSLTTIEMFQMTTAQCIYETEERRSHTNATDSDIKQYILHDAEDAKTTETGAKSTSVTSALSEQFHIADELVVFRSDNAGYYVFDSSSGLFVPRQTDARAVIVRDGKKPYEYWLYIVTPDSKTPCHQQRIDPDATQHLDRASGSFIWCFFTENGYIWTFSLKFPATTAVLALANAYNQAVYETLNHEKWAKVGQADASYLLNPMLDVEMTQALPLELDSDEEDDLSDEESSADSDADTSTSTARRDKRTDGSKNQMLSVGFTTDRSFVARGSSVGVFKHTSEDGLGFVTDTKVQTLSGRSFAPSKMMLHQEDRALLLMNPDDPHSVYKMDLERGKVVDEWKIHEDSRITAMVPDAKYAQMTDQQTFIGLNANSIFRVDPRLAGTKRVDAEMKQYVVKNEFSCGATTGAGELAVASAKGEIRLFNKLDKRAKTLLPMFGDPIVGIDVTESGKYILATCKTYLLLIDTELEGGDVLGFTKSMGGNKPVPKRLQLKPEHVAYMGTQPAFTPARFSTGQSEERSIITSTGPYVITWNLRRVKQGHLHDYQIKRYEDKVVADNFRFGQDRSIVVALPEHVTLISKKSLAAPSPKALRSGRDIVDSGGY